jgi:hypothetical protein
MLRLELTDFQFYRHKAVQLAVKEQQINEEVAIADLNAIFIINEREVFAKLQYEVF